MTEEQRNLLQNKGGYQIAAEKFRAARSLKELQEAYNSVAWAIDAMQENKDAQGVICLRNAYKYYLNQIRRM